jgi:hypothetical protein
MASSVTAASIVNAANSAASPTGAAFKQLSFYLAKNEVALYPKWNVYDTLFGSIKWEPNMGSVLTGTTPTPSPVLRTTFMPEILTAFPKKDQFTVGERTEDASLGMHRFESNRFRFLSNFESFWRDHLSYAQADIVRQIQCANNVFIRTLMYYQAPDMYISGKGLSSQLTHGTATGAGTIAKRSLAQSDIRGIEAASPGGGTLDNVATVIAAGTHLINKSGGTLFRNDIVTGGAAASTAAVTAGVLTLKEIFKAMLVLQEDIQAPTFDKTYGAPKTSEMVKGKYVLICSTEAWASLLWDTNLRTGHTTAGETQLAPANMNLLQDGFAGDLFGKITAKFDPYPMRCDHDGNLVVPQTQDAASGKVVPNPAYNAIGNGTGAGAAGTADADGNASHEIAFLVGADAFKTINVGPPPKEFAGKNMNAKKFYSMKWNGEVTLTDQFLIPTGITGSEVGGIDGSSGSELNVYGDYLKFISQAVIGGIAGDARYCLPIIFKRQRTS